MVASSIVTNTVQQFGISWIHRLNPALIKIAWSLFRWEITSQSGLKFKVSLPKKLIKVKISHNQFEHEWNLCKEILHIHSKLMITQIHVETNGFHPTVNVTVWLGRIKCNKDHVHLTKSKVWLNKTTDTYNRFPQPQSNSIKWMWC